MTTPLVAPRRSDCPNLSRLHAAAEHLLANQHSAVAGISNGISVSPVRANVRCSLSSLGNLRSRIPAYGNRDKLNSTVRKRESRRVLDMTSGGCEAGAEKVRR